EFASWFTKTPIIAITGSNGKTTTTSLIWYLLTSAGYNAKLVGNVGFSFAKAVYEQQTQNKFQKSIEVWVLEISSFQLDDIEKFKPHIAVLTNITPDHLDRYNYQFENYIASKFKIIKNQTETDYFIYNHNDPVTMQYLLQYNNNKAQQGSFGLEEEAITHQNQYPDKNKNIEALLIDTSTKKTQQQTPPEIKLITPVNQTILPTNKLQILGKHNLYNAMAACLAASLFGMPNSQLLKGLNSFSPLEHRLEPCGTIEGVTFINDSKATNVDSTFYALDALTQPIIWVVGGKDKGNDYNTIMHLVQQKVKTIVCLGIDNTPIDRSFAHLKIPIFYTKSAAEAVKTAFGNAQKGDAVLLSPACASFDLFKNYEDRGRQFKTAVQNLLNSITQHHPTISG
ncbi:MAG TPA: UDP-N-acetylmuramoyl-L-alanine--D-glutamate ligase, partial [Chitinophagales bacterium]|nr:UDP-N-acetylmuramoyl-L-alanine--D-glutamate ligase [Chitinophagales bacterium]